MSFILKFGIFVAGTVILIALVNIIFDILFEKKARIQLKFFKSIVNVFIVIASSYVFLSQFAITKDVGKAVLQSGTIIVALVTILIQKALQNLVSGISLSLSRPFEVGHKIKIVSATGTIVSEGVVDDINLRHTVISRFNGNCDIVPNSTIDSCIVSNTDFKGDIGTPLDIEFSRTCEDSKDKAIELFGFVVAQEPLVLKSHKIEVRVKTITENGVVLRVMFWTESIENKLLARSNILSKLLDVCNENNITVIADVTSF